MNREQTTSVETGQTSRQGAGSEGGGAASPDPRLDTDGPMIQPQFITLKVAAATVGLSPITLKRAIKAGKLRAFKPAGMLLIRPKDLEDWVEARPVKAEPASHRPVHSEQRLIDQVLTRRVGNG